MLWTLLPDHQHESFKEYQTGRRIATACTAATKLALLSYGGTPDTWATTRQAWYRLAANFPTNVVADLGHLQGDEAGLLETLATLRQQHIFPILLSTTPLIVPPLVRALAAPHLHIAIADSHLDYAWGDEPPALLNQLWQLRNEAWQQLTWLGQQSYYVDNNVLAMLEQAHAELLRLGQLRQNIEEVEPVLRDVDMLGIHLGTVRYSDAPASGRCNPSGLWSEEVCRVVRYAAMSDKLQALALMGFDAQADASGLTANLLAQMVWFVVEGFLARKQDYPLQIEALKQYMVSIKEWDAPLTFFKSTRSERWWFGLPDWELQAADEQAFYLVPCSYRDYVEASDGELSERLWKRL